MATTDFSARGRERGVALFVVLGAIVLFTLLGVVGITLADRFARNSGSLVDMRSERMTAVGALNFSVAAMQANPTATIALLNAFRQDQSRSWLQLPSSSSGTIGLGDKVWTLLGTGNDQSSAAVKILGVGVPGADSVDILLEGHGKGRGGDEFKVQATYCIHGVGLSNNVPTAGTNNALQAQAGLNDINTSTNVDGGLYSGGTGTTTIQTPTTTPGSWQILRTNGSLQLNANVTLPSGAIINGTLGSNSSNLTMNGNLSVRGGITSFGGQLTVNGAMLLQGAAFPTNGFSGGLTVRDSLLVNDAFFSYAGSSVNGNAYTLNIGSGGSSWAVFNAGFRFNGVTSPISQINGNLFVKTAAASNTNRIDAGNLTVTGSTFFDADFTLAGGTLNLKNVAFRNAALRTDQGNGATMNVNGQSFFGRGIISNDNSVKTISLYDGDSYINGSMNPIASNRSAQITFNGGGNFYLSGAIRSNFGVSYPWTLKGTAPYVASPIITYMYPYGNPNVGSTCSYGWYSYPCDFSVTYASPVFKPLANVPAPTWSWLSTPTPTMTETSLGFTANQQNLDPTAASNAVSTISWSSLPAAVQTYADWTTLWALAHTSSPTIFPDLGGYAPTGTQLANLYNFVKSQGKLYGGSYMIIHVTSGTMGNVPTDITIPSGVKVFFEFDNVGSSGLTLYSGSSGSMQIVDAHQVGGRVTFSGSFYGFVQLHTTADIQFSPTTVGSAVPSFIGSLEVDGTGKVTVQNSGWSISNQSQAAKNVFQDIANTFNNSAVNSASVIKFNGDANTSTPLTSTPTVTASDNWIQFVRKGEFR